ncbi:MULTISPECIES: spore-associated protein A [Streptomyces]|uniref:spore-associated protein A n=1 Tax=Streptomyces TaxID=1883 RepID=UPI00093C359C|nr:MULTISPECIES: spore-associated protein A [unclassified Streptomyces]OKJ01341.1 spore-associated protein A [Streptomyces sp. TSRI0261]QNQ35578.1 spore-associated protein A [Streptomyces sp. CB00271]
MTIIRRASAIGAAVTATACAAIALAPAAAAAEPAAQRATAAPKAAAAAKYNGACGGGYSVVNSAQIGTKGTVFLTYNSATGKNCVVTVRTTPGKAVHMTASLGFASSTTTVTDTGYYTTYAGPVYLDARGLCVTWRGEIAGEVAGKNGTNCGSLAANRH